MGKRVLPLILQTDSPAQPQIAEEVRQTVYAVTILLIYSYVCYCVNPGFGFNILALISNFIYDN